MRNEFGRIGQIIYDFEANVHFEDVPDNYDFLEEEFRRITLALGLEWMKKEMGLPYLLEFHAEETQRLIKKARMIQMLYIQAPDFQNDKEFSHSVLEAIIESLTLMVDRIDKMRKEDPWRAMNGIDFSPN